MVLIQIHNPRAPSQPSPAANSGSEEQLTTEEVPKKKQRVEKDAEYEDQQEDDVMGIHQFFSLDCSTFEDFPSQSGSLFGDWPKHYDVILFTNIKKTQFLSNSIFESFTVVMTSKQHESSCRMALLTKIPPEKIKFQYSNYGGQVIIADFDRFTFVGVTAPFVGDDFEDIEERLQWNTLFMNKVMEMDKVKPVVIAGDFKVAKEMIDIGEMDEDNLEETPRFSLIERMQFTNLLGSGFMDTFREKNSEVQKFTTVPGELYPPFVSYRANYVLVSCRVMSQVVHSDIMMDDCMKSHPTVAEIFL